MEETSLHDAAQLDCWMTQLDPGWPKIQINLGKTSNPAKNLQIKAIRVVAWEHNSINCVAFLPSSARGFNVEQVISLLSL